MERKSATEAVEGILEAFAARTGLTGSRPPVRYLWTDAFAVLALLELHRRTARAHPLRLALALVEQVHEVLGRHRPDDPRTGWISGLDEQEGHAHPTRAGLRIGKPLAERAPGEPLDERLEWERDGQYFHYLTKWMQALLHVARVSGEPHFLDWAVELARAAHRSFTNASAEGAPRMAWKMSIDGTRPLVPSMGQHDPLDGYLTFLELELETSTAGWPAGALRREVDTMRSLCAGLRLATADPLSLGGILTDALRLARLMVGRSHDGPALLEALLGAATSGLRLYAAQAPMRAPAEARLAFRELGLSIGLHAVPRLVALVEGKPASFSEPIRSRAAGLARFQPLGGGLEGFWLDPTHQRTASWQAHLDIDAVMLATSLAPDTYLSD